MMQKSKKAFGQRFALVLCCGMLAVGAQAQSAKAALPNFKITKGADAKEVSALKSEWIRANYDTAKRVVVYEKNGASIGVTEQDLDEAMRTAQPAAKPIDPTQPRMEAVPN